VEKAQGTQAATVVSHSQPTYCPSPAYSEGAMPYSTAWQVQVMTLYPVGALAQLLLRALYVFYQTHARALENFHRIPKSRTTALLRFVPIC
jgi:hypothetical protein